MLVKDLMLKHQMQKYEKKQVEKLTNLAERLINLEESRSNQDFIKNESYEIKNNFKYRGQIVEILKLSEARNYDLRGLYNELDSIRIDLEETNRILEALEPNNNEILNLDELFRIFSRQDFTEYLIELNDINITLEKFSQVQELFKEYDKDRIANLMVNFRFIQDGIEFLKQLDSIKEEEIENLRCVEILLKKLEAGNFHGRRFSKELKIVKKRLEDINFIKSILDIEEREDLINCLSQLHRFYDNTTIIHILNNITEKLENFNRIKTVLKKGSKKNYSRMLEEIQEFTNGTLISENFNEIVNDLENLNNTRIRFRIEDFNYEEILNSFNELSPILNSISKRARPKRRNRGNILREYVRFSDSKELFEDIMIPEYFEVLVKICLFYSIKENIDEISEVMNFFRFKNILCVFSERNYLDALRIISLEYNEIFIVTRDIIPIVEHIINERTNSINEKLVAKRTINEYKEDLRNPICQDLGLNKIYEGGVSRLYRIVHPEVDDKLKILRSVKDDPDWHKKYIKTLFDFSELKSKYNIRSLEEEKEVIDFILEKFFEEVAEWKGNRTTTKGILRRCNMIIEIIDYYKNLYYFGSRCRHAEEIIKRNPLPKGTIWRYERINIDSRFENLRRYPLQENV